MKLVITSKALFVDGKKVVASCVNLPFADETFDEVEVQDVFLSIAAEKEVKRVSKCKRTSRRDTIQA